MSASDAYLALVQADYRAYCYYIHGGRWIPGKAVSYLCDRVQEFLRRDKGAAYEVLILSVPPQHGKSMTITETLPSWYLGRNPDKRVIEISYSEDFAQLFGRRNRDKIQRAGDIFGVALSRSTSSATEWEIEGHAGGMISRGILSGVTGRPADLMIIDDPIKTRQEADSETIRERIWDEWESSFRTRLQAGAKVILIQTRWHEDDLAGRMIQREPNVEVINLPCEAEENDPLGRPVGAALAPEIGKDDRWLADFKRGFLGSQGSRAWTALFQGHPTSQEGNLIKREWWRYYDALPRLAEVLISVDAAFKDGDDNDYVAVQAWGKTGPNMYLLDATKKHLDFPGTLREIRAMRRRWPEARIILVEDKANGSAVVQILRREIPGVIPVNPEGGKVARANAVSGAIESGNVYLPRNALFTGDFVDECSSFPLGEHDDQVDAMTQALNRFIYWAAEFPLVADEDAPPLYETQVNSFLSYGS